jgi:peptidylprolyl isomerase/FKBP-type peptidyl-prolyl cis-trans isomerase FklB
VKVNYEGALLDGTVFDSTYQRGEPAVFGVTGLIPAWTEALQLMRPGDEWELVTPPELGYGDAGAGPIPPGAVLKFRIELIAISPVDGGR